MTHVSPTRILHHCERCGEGFYPKRTCNTRFCGRACGLAYSAEKLKVMRAEQQAVMDAMKPERERAKAEAKAQRQAEREAQRKAEAQRLKVEKVKRDALAKAEHYKPRPCQQCGETFQPVKGNLSKCKPCVADNKAATKRAAKAVDRAKRKALPGVRIDCFDPYEIFERDGWTCQECGKETPKALRGLNRMDSPELDHVRALRAGGSHTPDNTQCLCRLCNLEKSYRDADEVRAFESAESMTV